MKSNKVILIFFVFFIISGVLFHQKNVSAASFPDVNAYDEEINYLTGLKIINGFPDGTYKPGEPIKRIQAVQMILREMGVEAVGAPNPGFHDMKPGSYGYEEVAKAVELGIISGKPDGTFDPNGKLTRGQMAKILAESYELGGFYPYAFPDVSFNHWSYEYVNVLAANNITTGYPDQTFRPSQEITRMHFAAFMARLLEPSFKPAVSRAADTLIEGLFDISISDSTIHPDQPIIYLLNEYENELLKLNYETYEMDSITLPLPSEQIHYANGKVYVTMLKSGHQYYAEEALSGAIGIIDANSFTFEKNIDINMDPFDIVADNNGVMYVSSGSNQWTEIASFSPTGEKLSEQRIRHESYLAINPKQTKVYAIDTDVSPRDITAYAISDGKLIESYDSPYHGDYVLRKDMTLSPDGKYLFNSSGNVFRLTDLNSADLQFVTKFTVDPYDAIAFDIKYDELYAAQQNLVQVYQYSTLGHSYSLSTYGTALKMFYKDNRLFVLTNLTVDGIPKPFVALEVIEYIEE